MESVQKKKTGERRKPGISRESVRSTAAITKNSVENNSYTPPVSACVHKQGLNCLGCKSKNK